MKKEFNWTEEELEVLIKSLEDKIDYTTIGLMLGKSKSAVSGRVTRLRAAGLLPRIPTPKNPRPKWNVNRLSPPKIKVKISSITNQFLAKANRPKVITMDAEQPMGKYDIVSVKAGQCRYPYGEPTAHMLVCGEPTLSLDCAWCAIHYKRTHQARNPNPFKGTAVKKSGMALRMGV